MFHESIARLVTRGVESGDKALVSDYNGELVNCILAYVEEVDIRRAGKGVYNRIKAWTTAATLSIRPLYHQAYEVRNCLHLVQSSNDLSSLPIAIGDSRITAVYVCPLDNPMPKEELEAFLDSEAPHFMHTLLNMDIPSPRSRLALDIIETASRRTAIDMTTAPVKDFLIRSCYCIDGCVVSFEDFYTRIKEHAQREEGKVFDMSRGEVEDILLGMDLPIGTYRNQKHIGNLSFDHNAKATDAFKCVEGTLVR